jgi:hypothetical protein
MRYNNLFLSSLSNYHNCCLYTDAPVITYTSRDGLFWIKIIVVHLSYSIQISASTQSDHDRFILYVYYFKLKWIQTRLTVQFTGSDLSVPLAEEHGDKFLSVVH